MLRATDATMPQWTAGMSAAGPSSKVGEADRDNEERFESLAEGDDERLQHC